MKTTRRQIGFAMVASMVALLGSYAIIQAAPVSQTPAPAVTVNLFTAFIVGVLYYAANSPFFANLGFTVLFRPLIAGTLVGIVMGRPMEGIAIGANINVLYLGWIAPGGSLPGDPGLAGYLGTALALSGGLDHNAALAVAAPLGLLGGLTFSLRMSICSVIAHRADRFAEEGNIAAVARSNYLYSQPFLFVLYAVPVMLAAYLGSAAVASALGWFAANAIWVMSGLFIASGMLAALGIALNLKFLLRGQVWPYFFVGYVATTILAGKTNLLMLAIVGAAAAYFHVLFTTREEPIPAAGPAAPARKAPGLLTRGDVFGAWLRWLFFSHSTWNWERMQGLGFAHSMTPIIAKLYKNKSDISAALKRHLVFFNTQPDVGGVIHGIVIAMEEERAAGAEISDDAINGIKCGLMGPMSGIGDTVQQGIIIPILLALGMSIATGGAVGQVKEGNFLGPIFFVVSCAICIWGIGWFLWWQGYVQGRAAVTNILQGGALNKVITGAGVLGNFIMGALAVTFVKLSTPVVFSIGGSRFEVQKIVDSFMPNLLPLLLVLLVWWLIARRNLSPTWVMAGLILVGLLGAIPIWPGIDAASGKALMVGIFG